MLAAAKGPSTTWKTQWGGYDIHNPAPLWQVNSEDDKNAWTIRANVNDHSVFGRKPGTLRNIDPGWGGLSVEASKECYAARDSEFRTKGSAPLAKPIEGLTSGGFLQIQDLAPDGARLQTCVNVWGPVVVGIYDREGNVEDKDTFTLRNRMVSFDSYETKDSIQPLQCVKWHDKDGLIVYRLMVQQKADKQAVTLSGWKVKDSSGKDQVKFDSDKSWAFESTNLFKDSPITEAPTNPNLIRALAGSFRSQADVNLALLKFSTSGPVEVNLISKDGKARAGQTLADTKGVYNYVKTLKSGNSDQVLLASFQDGGAGATKMALNVVNLAGDAPAVTKHEATIQVSSQSSKSVLVSFQVPMARTLKFYLLNLDDTGRRHAKDWQGPDYRSLRQPD